jgi:hypothetical protein
MVAVRATEVAEGRSELCRFRARRQTPDELLQGIKCRKGPGFGSHGYYREHPSEED